MMSFLPRRSPQPAYSRLHNMAAIPAAEPISLLCLAGRQSTAVIEATALQLGLGIVKTRTLAEATRAWTDRRSEFGAVVLALGSDTDTNIFKGALFSVAAASPAALIVFSHTACRNPATRSLLLSECGCDAVVNCGPDLADTLVANCLHQ